MSRVTFACGGCGTTGLRAEEIGAGRDGRPRCLPCVRGSRVRKAKTLPAVAGYSCATCLFPGLAPDEVTVNQHQQVVCYDCARSA